MDDRLRRMIETGAPIVGASAGAAISVLSGIPVLSIGAIRLVTVNTALTGRSPHGFASSNIGSGASGPSDDTPQATTRADAPIRQTPSTTETRSGASRRARAAHLPTYLRLSVRIRRSLVARAAPCPCHARSATLVAGLASHDVPLHGRMIFDPAQPKPDSFAFPLPGHPIHRLDRYSHGPGERLEVTKGGVGRTEGVHQHERPPCPIPLSLVNG